MQQTPSGKKSNSSQEPGGGASDGSTPSTPPPPSPLGAPNPEPGTRKTLAAQSTGGLILRLVGLALLDAVALFMAYTFINTGGWVIAIILAVITIGVNYIYLDERVYPIRWLTPGLLLMILMVIYPLGFTIYVALTNYGDGHLLSKEQVVSRFTGQYFQPENSTAYTATIYVNPDPSVTASQATFLVVFTDEQGNNLVGTETDTLKPLEAAELPPTLKDSTGKEYARLQSLQTLRFLDRLTALTFTDGTNLVRITGRVAGQVKAAQLEPTYTFNSANDQLTDNQTGVVYTAVKGTFTAPDGKTLDPGYNVVVGFENYARVITDPNVRGPFFGVFIWTFMFALLSVILTFGVGLAMAIVLNDKQLPFKGLWRALIIIPYAIPGVISVLIWRGLLNPNYGQFSAFIANIFGQSPQWFIDGTWAKAGILLINTWLGYPYMMLICLGALQSIPTDMYEAADIDGASKWLQFRRLTLPLLLVSVAPLLIGSFAFNFNNFGMIEAYNKGGPAIPGVSTPAGQTDILISYTFRLAFAGGQGADYGLASAIGLFIFLLVGAITIFNFRYTKQLEEVV